MDIVRGVAGTVPATGNAYLSGVAGLGGTPSPARGPSGGIPCRIGRRTAARSAAPHQSRDLAPPDGSGLFRVDPQIPDHPKEDRLDDLRPVIEAACDPLAHAAQSPRGEVLHGGRGDRRFRRDLPGSIRPWMRRSTRGDRLHRAVSIRSRRVSGCSAAPATRGSRRRRQVAGGSAAQACSRLPRSGRRPSADPPPSRVY